jgi:hypothetical protein
MERSMMGDTAKAMGGSMEAGEGNDIGTIQVDASIANLETLFAKMGEYKIQLAEISALETDYKNGMSESA